LWQYVSRRCRRLDIIEHPQQQSIHFNYHLFSFSVPIHTSSAFRRFVESLFITHTEAKLNTDGHLDKLLFPDDGIMITPNNTSQQHDPWCKNLIRRSS
jgi:hypothetical protein